MKLSYLKRPLAVMMAFSMTLGMNSLSAFAADGTESTDDSYKYVYAGLTWEEYWKSEGVYLSGNNWTASSDEVDAKGETDKGAFDAVTRATTTHGLHRGSFQSSAVIYDTEGNQYPVSYWEDGSTIVLTDGSKISFSKGTISYTDAYGTQTKTMDHYEVKGIKYVPVKVSAKDYDTFAKKYNIVSNKGTLQGGYSEQQLNKYRSTANVTAETNGLKTATLNPDGSFSFSERKTGNDSGIMDDSSFDYSNTAIKTASNITVTVKSATGSYGEFLRVDLTGDGYGDLGSNLQAVRWDYYGTDESQSTPLVSYGTKFAADNWMHKSMGIQLGLTDSLRCQLPSGTDGTGKWILTTYALGYEDYSFEINVTSENIVSDEEDEIDTSKLESAVKEASALKESDYTAASWAAMQAELEEAQDELKAPHTQATVDEALSHLQAAIKDLVKAQTSDNTTDKPDDTTPAPGNSTDKPSDTTQTPGNVTDKPSDTTQTPGNVTDKPSDTTQTPGNVTDKPSDTTQTPGSVTDKPSNTTQTPNTNTAKAVIKTYGGKAFSIKKSGATYKSSNKNVISVSKAGKATIKGVGKTVITVKTKTKTTKTTYVVKPGKIASKSIKVVNNASKKLKVTWKKKAGLGLTAKKAYYQIQYSTSKKFTKKTTKTLTVKGSASSKTISKLKKGKTYYVRMRGYDKTNKKSGSWSTVKKVKVKK